jgi:hypothetical protein
MLMKLKSTKFLKCLILFALLSVQSSFAAPLSVRVTPREPSPGNTISILIEGLPTTDKPVLRFEGKGLPVYPTGKKGRWKALLGIPATLAAGTHSLEIKTSGMPPAALGLKVRAGAFPSESITFTPEKRKLLAAGPSESRKLRGLTRTETPKQRWKGKFLWPVKGKILTGYGIRRNYEDYHRGVDIQSTQGKRVVASAPGKVLLAEKLTLHGNTLLIDHGQGVMSIYLHLSKFLVKEGDVVKKKQPVGLVGSTGLSTAPHLHWGVYVHGVPVNPIDWTRNKF